jgi:hypothetical protein
MTPNILLAPSAPVEPLYIRDDGYVVDVETGEIIRHEEQPDAFAVTDEASANWVLGKWQDEDAAIAGLEEARQRQHKAIDENFDRKIQIHVRRKNWLSWRFLGQLKEYAESALSDGKRRTLALTNGCLSFRRKPASTKIDVTDLRKAVAWCEENEPTAIKVSTSILTTPLKGLVDRLPTDAFEVTVTEAVDSFAVDTGID